MAPTTSTRSPQSGTCPPGADRVTHLLYLHGFRSSPLSAKSRQLHDHVTGLQPAVTWWGPQLPPSPAEAIAQVTEGTATWPREHMAVVGSSLGGFYAQHLAEAWGCRAVLLNPAVTTRRDLSHLVGEHTQWHNPQERFVFRPEYLDELRAMDVPRLTRPRRYLAIVAKGDEVLDWRTMAAHCADTQLVLLEGGDHALSDFTSHLPTIDRFLGWA